MTNSIFNPQNYFFNLYALPHFLVGVLISMEGIFIFTQSRKSIVHTAYLITTVTAGMWLTGVGFICFSSNEVTAFIWSRYYTWFGIIFITPAVYLFSATWDDALLRKKAKIIYFNYFTASVFYVICISSTYLIQGVWHYPQGFFPKAGLLEGPFIIWFYTLMILSFRNFIRNYRKEKVPIKKKNTKLMIIAFAIAFFGSVEYLPNYGIHIFPFAPLPVFLFVSIMGYCVIRHHLFDLEAIAQAFQKEKLATIGLLASSINHEIRNPLYAARSLLSNYIEMTQEGVQLKDPLQVSEKALKQIDHALDVITKLNRFARPSEEGQETRTNIQEALQNVLDLVSYGFSLEKIKIYNQIPDHFPLIQADQRQLEEILFNLIVNACHAMEQGGELTITASCHSEQSKPLSSPNVLIGDQDSRLKRAGMTAPSGLRMTKTGSQTTDKVKIIITDTGTGIPQDQMKHIFEPFHTTKGDKGTGLGLYITKQLVERNGGKITVQSKERKGTAFLLEFKAV